MLSLTRRALALLILLALASHSVRGESVELLVNGSFTNGVQGWKVWGIVYPGVGAELYARSRIPAGIAQTVEIPDFSSDMSLSYRVTTVFHSFAGFPFLDISVTAYKFDETTVLLYSKKYYSDSTFVTKSYDVTVDLKEKLSQGRESLKRIKVMLEAGFEDTHVLMQSTVYVHRVSLLMTRTSPPPTITTTLTITMTATEAITATETIRQRTPVMPIELVYVLVLVAVLAAGTVVGVAIYIHSKRGVAKR